MDGWTALLGWLPPPLGRVLARIPTDSAGQIHEVRLYAGRAVAVGIGGGLRFVTENGTLTVSPTAWRCEDGWIREIVDRACGQSMYAHGEELRHGFLPAPAGCRIGIAGTAVTNDGVITGYRRITSLCIRIARDHGGCAAALARLVCRDGVQGLLLCGEPSSGKTTILRELIRECTACGKAVAVVDERGELTDGDVPCACDVLRGAPKAGGILQAVRTLSPQAVVFDELGGEDEILAIAQALVCGVPVIASIHSGSFEELRRRETLYPALGSFTYLAQLCGREMPGEIAAVVRTEDWYENGGNAVDLFGGGRLRDKRRCAVASAGGVSGSHRTMVGGYGGTHPLYGGTAR